MSVYRRKYRVNGEARIDRFYSCRFTSADGRLIRRSTKCTGRRAAEAFETRLRQKMEDGSVGILDAVEAAKPIQDHIQRYADSLAEAGRDEMYVYTVHKRLIRVAMEAGWRRMSDISLESFESWRTDAAKTPHRGRLPKAKTLNQYLDVCRQFVAWAHTRKLIRSNPLTQAIAARVIHDPNYRRAATTEELNKLLASVDDDRRRFYTFALYSALRRGTLKKIRWSALHLDDATPYIEIRGEDIKSRRPERTPLHPVAVEAMKAWKAKHKPDPNDLVFPQVPRPDQVAEDIKAAGIAVDDGRGSRRLDLHAFRRTVIRMLREAGVPLHQAAAMLHHKDWRTTQKYYDDGAPIGVADVAAKLPVIGGKQRKGKGA